MYATRELTKGSERLNKSKTMATSARDTSGLAIIIGPDCPLKRIDATCGNSDLNKMA